MNPHALAKDCLMGKAPPTGKYKAEWISRTQHSLGESRGHLEAAGL